jgi:hypothetical protein
MSETTVLIGQNLKPDTVITWNGQCVWLKEAFDQAGKRVGVAVCCQQTSPCRWHSAIGLVPTNHEVP